MGSNEKQTAITTIRPPAKNMLAISLAYKETDKKAAVFSSTSSFFIIPAIPLPITQAPITDKQRTTAVSIKTCIKISVFLFPILIKTSISLFLDRIHIQSNNEVIVTPAINVNISISFITRTILSSGTSNCRNNISAVVISTLLLKKSSNSCTRTSI